MCKFHVYFHIDSLNSIIVLLNELMNKCKMIKLVFQTDMKNPNDITIAYLKQILFTSYRFVTLY